MLKFHDDYSAYQNSQFKNKIEYCECRNDDVTNVVVDINADDGIVGVVVDVDLSQKSMNTRSLY